jgi:hypothetical protein
MLADSEEVDADLVGQDSFVDDMADRLGVRQRTSLGAEREVPERVETDTSGKRALVILAPTS